MGIIAGGAEQVKCLHLDWQDVVSEALDTTWDLECYEYKSRGQGAPRPQLNEASRAGMYA